MANPVPLSPAGKANPMQVTPSEFSDLMQRMYPKESEIVILRLQNAKMQKALYGEKNHTHEEIIDEIAEDEDE